MLRTADKTAHAFMRTRPSELNISWDRVDAQSQIDHRVAMSSPTADAERLGPRPDVEHFAAERPGDGDARFQPADAHRQLPRPTPEVVRPPKLMDRRLDQRPAQPGRAGLGNPPGPAPAATALD